MEKQIPVPESLKQECHLCRVQVRLSEEVLSLAEAESE